MRRVLTVAGLLTATHAAMLARGGWAGGVAAGAAL